MSIKFESVKPGDKEYPHIAMACVEHPERYDIYKLTMMESGNSVYFVPLVQVLDGISTIKSDYTIKDGKKYCSNCWREVDE